PQPGIGPVLDVDREREGGQQRADARTERGDGQQAETGIPQRQQLTADSCQGAANLAPFCPTYETPDRTCPRQTPKKAFSSGVPTVTRIASGAPNPASGRTITPWRRSRSKSAAPSPTSTNRKFPIAGPAGSRPLARSVSSNSARPALFSARRRASSGSSP